MKILLIILLSSLGLVRSAHADTLDFWHVYYNGMKILELDKDAVYEGLDEIVIKTDSIKNTDYITVRYGKDTDCIPCTSHLTVEDSKYHNAVIRVHEKNVDFIRVLSFPISTLINFKKLNGKNTFRVLFSETWPGHETENKHLIFRLKLIDESSIESQNLQGTKPPENIWLGVDAKRSSKSKEIIDIEAILFNDNPDTVYFLSTTCNGEQYSLQYDTTKFELTPLMMCNASALYVAKIMPFREVRFKARFKNLTGEYKIKLGFDLYLIDKSFDLKIFNESKHDIRDIYNRKNNETIVVWANDKDIEWK